jgi:hypothetical protein
MFRKLPYMHFDMLPRYIQIDMLNRPWRSHAKQLSVQFHAVHRTPPCQAMRESVLPPHRKV